jgi:hypothetical protein
MVWIALGFLSVGIAAIGYGLVVAASRIENRLRERHTERFGDH